MFSFYLAKVRAKIRNSPDIVVLIVKILSGDDTGSISNAAECIIMMSEDSKWIIAAFI